MSVNIPEEVILVYNEDDDLIGVVRPDDPLNPGFTVDLLEVQGLKTSLQRVNSSKGFIDYFVDISRRQEPYHYDLDR